ncbi:hypothetical protein BP00DRAFT_427206 [Aspergillus indologenus CBS 114.80]|uniref:Uncharacterized protein n=1 Tax=Aspergillus indologenus CBS 114.80 TaxID=1450541 RepID=A0A2V5I6L2_9EURO|nr:hypothetical protein BP00DRAFT_427206 [Aspergillus indologenus CBS 114.80]
MIVRRAWTAPGRRVDRGQTPQAQLPPSMTPCSFDATNYASVSNRPCGSGWFASEMMPTWCFARLLDSNRWGKEFWIRRVRRNSGKRNSLARSEGPIWNFSVRFGVCVLADQFESAVLDRVFETFPARPSVELVTGLAVKGSERRKAAESLVWPGFCVVSRTY